MKSVIVLVPLLCLIVSATAAIGAWPKPWEVSNEEPLMETNHHHNKFSFKDSKIWKCVSNNGSGAAISISYPGPPQPSNKSPPPPKRSLPPPPAPEKSLPPPPNPKMSPSPPKPSLPPPQSPKSSPPPPTPSPPPPTPKSSPPPPTPSPRPPRPLLPPPTASPPPPPTLKKSQPAPKPSPTPPTPSPALPATPKKSTPASPTEPTRPEPSTYYNPWGQHVRSCYSNFASSAICKHEMVVSYFTRWFHVSEYCCNLIVKMRHECADVFTIYFHDPFFVPLLHCTCHVKY